MIRRKMELHPGICKDFRFIKNISDTYIYLSLNIVISDLNDYYAIGSGDSKLLLNYI